MLPGHGAGDLRSWRCASPDLAGIHFTGSTRVFQGLWGQVGENIAGYRSYPRLVGETGGKDFVVAHPSADSAAADHRADPGCLRVLRPEVLGGVALLPAAVDLGGQARPRTLLIDQTEALQVGDVRDFANFTSAVIDERAFEKLSGAIERAQRRPPTHRSWPAAPTTAVKGGTSGPR